MFGRKQPRQRFVFYITCKAILGEAKKHRDVFASCTARFFRNTALCKCYYWWRSVGWNKGSHTRFAQVWGLLWRSPLCIGDVISLTQWLILLRALKAESDWSSESDTQFSWRSICTSYNSPALISPSSCMATSRVSDAREEEKGLISISVIINIWEWQYFYPLCSYLTVTLHLRVRGCIQATAWK